MELDVVIPTMLVILLLASIAVLVGGIVLATKGSGRWKAAGGWVAIVASLFVLAWGAVLVMGAIAASMQA